METNTLPDPVKFCPVCKMANRQDALVCEYCGTVLVDLQLENKTTENMPNRRATDRSQNKYELKTPPKGIAFFLYGKTEPIAIKADDEIYLGRLDKETTEVFVDLTYVDGFAEGVSRRHAMIRRVDSRYEITDMFSNNGTYLDGQRLLPSKPYQLKSGMVIQLGRLKLIPIFS